jgi:hypothetical protein
VKISYSALNLEKIIFPFDVPVNMMQNKLTVTYSSVIAVVIVINPVLLQM